MRALVYSLLIASLAGQAAPLPEGLRLLPGPVNGLLLRGNVLVYGDPDGAVAKVRYVLFTHSRRDVVWAGAPLVAMGAAAVAPEAERELFENPGAFWARYEKARFHDYSMVNTKVSREAMRVSRAVRGGDVLDLDGVRVEVIDTPGYSRGAVSYWIEVGGKRIACTGDLIYGDGQLMDLTSLQDAIPETKTRGYHGYAARAGTLIESLRKIAARNPDLIVPARGPLIENPRQSIAKLIARLQTLMASHFSTDALRWYWGEESLRVRSSNVLDGRPVDSMPMAEQRPLPAWALPIGNSRLLLSRSGNAFLIDAGAKALFAKLDELTASGAVKTVEGIWITHYHDDHTEYAQALADRFHCPLYFTSRIADVLERPSHYRLPCLTANPITSGKPQPDGARMRWHEFQFTFFDFPGQTLYHGGLLVEHDSGESLFFAGDSFTPSGIDDYCLQNRNFAGEDEGFHYCLGVLERLNKERLSKDAWLVNQHVQPLFRFSGEHFARMRAELAKRRAVIAELSPWPAANYAVDENWAAVHPYGATVKKGEPLSLRLRIRNHAPRTLVYRLNWNVPSGWRVLQSDNEISVAPISEADARVTISTGAGIPPADGLHVVTAGVEFDGRQLREWAEALVRVER